MNRFAKVALTAALVAAPLMASEEFGGIGITIYQVPAGVHVVEVIPGGPAAESKLAVGDEIIAIDGISLKGKSIDESKNLIRGQVNRPVELTYVSGGDTYTATVRRAQMRVENLDGEAVTKWYNGQQEFSVEELETFAAANTTDKKLLTVLSNGRTIPAEQTVGAKGLDGIFVEKAEAPAPSYKQTNSTKSNGAKLRGFDRQKISFSLKNAGTVVVKVSDASGNMVFEGRLDNANVGINSVSWNGANVPSGRYMVSFEQLSGVSGKFAVLK